MQETTLHVLVFPIIMCALEKPYILGKNVISGTVRLAQSRTIWLGILTHLSCFLESVKARAK